MSLYLTPARGVPSLSGPRRALIAAVAEGGMPGIAAIVADRNGIIHESCHGFARSDSIWRLFSMTKLVAGYGLAHLAASGRIDLDAPVADYVPEFVQLRVLDGFDGDQPILRAPASAATVRQLASHSSGCVYPLWNAALRLYAQKTGLGPPDTNSLAGLLAQPLAFDPGTEWGYGTGTDWLGLVLQAVTGERVEDWFAREVFAPLGMAGTCFALDTEAEAHLVPVFKARDGIYAPTEIRPAQNPEHYGLGNALFGPAADYMTFLRAVLAAEGPVADLLFTPTGPAPVMPIPTTHPGTSADVALFPGTPLGHSIGGLMTLADVPGKRRAGSLGWAGLLNTHYWIDREAGIAAVLMMQHLPFADAGAMAVYDAFERAVYAELG